VDLKSFLIQATRRLGFYPQKLINKKSLDHLMELLRPIENGFDLIRVGPDADGGYLVPDDLGSVDICFSPGVSDNWGFEKELFSKSKISSYMFDASVNAPSNLTSNQMFVKKFVGKSTYGDYLSISDIFIGYLTGFENILAQIDIEGFEYDLFDTISINDLLKFRIIVCEFHNLDFWIQNKFYTETLLPILGKLYSNFDLVHYHPNTGGGFFSYKGIKIPKTVELTFHRKNVSKGYFGFRKLPHALDIDNKSN
jgi:hypothetical protein